MVAALQSFAPHHAEEEEEEKELTLERHLTSVNPRQNWYTLTTQNGQPLYKWPLPPFIDQGGERLTMWDLIPPFTFLSTFPTHMCERRTSPICPPFLVFRSWPEIFTRTRSYKRR